MPHILQASVGGLHAVRPSPEATLPTADRSKVQALALIDLGVVDPALAGRKVPFISYFINESLTFTQAADGTWSQDTEHGDALEWAEPFEGGVEQFANIAPVAEAALVEVERVDERAAGIWFQIGGEPRWVQSDENPGPDYIFVGQMECWYANGTIYGFYHAEKQAMHFECQFS
ncbi:MAG: hypothetical protein ACI8RZ_001178 [Myxococcota bacterium]